MVNFYNNLNPASVKLPFSSGSNITTPPVNAPLPNHILAPGFAPALPQRAIPQPPKKSVKEMFDSLPSLFNINRGK